MRRRGFLAGLLALPFVAPIARLASKVKARFFPVVYLGGAGPDGARTLREALSKVDPGGGVIYVMPGTWSCDDGVELELEHDGALVVGVGNERPTLRGDA
jgi:hypothetical protein